MEAIEEPNIIEASVKQEESRLATVKFSEGSYDPQSDSVTLTVLEADIKPGDTFVLTRSFVEHPTLFGQSGSTVVARSIYEVGKALYDQLDRIASAFEATE